jgi:hypothetical protein
MVHNTNSFAHTFTVDELSTDETLILSSKKLVKSGGDAGTHTAYCRHHGWIGRLSPYDSGAEASLTVRFE